MQVHSSIMLHDIQLLLQHCRGFLCSPLSVCCLVYLAGRRKGQHRRRRRLWAAAAAAGRHRLWCAAWRCLRRPRRRDWPIPARPVLRGRQQPLWAAVICRSRLQLCPRVHTGLGCAECCSPLRQQLDPGLRHVLPSIRSVQPRLCVRRQHSQALWPAEPAVPVRRHACLPAGLRGRHRRLRLRQHAPVLRSGRGLALWDRQLRHLWAELGGCLDLWRPDPRLRSAAVLPERLQLFLGCFTASQRQPVWYNPWWWQQLRLWPEQCSRQLFAFQLVHAGPELGQHVQLWRAVHSRAVAQYWRGPVRTTVLTRVVYGWQHVWHAAEPARQQLWHLWQSAAPAAADDGASCHAQCVLLQFHVVSLPWAL